MSAGRRSWWAGLALALAACATAPSAQESTLRLPAGFRHRITYAGR